MNYLITGGCGVIGSVMARELLSQGHQVTIIDACESQRNEWIRTRLEKDAVILRGHLEEHGDHLVEILRQADGVIHAAASTGIPFSVGHPAEDWRCNVDATKVLLDALREVPRPTAVLSSIKPYRVEPLPPDGLTEAAVLDPDEPYAASKAAQSMLCLAYAHSYGLPVTTFRCSNLYGPAPCHGPRHGWMTWFAIAAAIGRQLEVQGTGEQTRDMLHAHDVLQACRLAMETPATWGKVFNIGGGKNNRISVYEVAKQLILQTGATLAWSDARKMDDAHVFVDFSAFREATGWRPTIAVRDGLAELLSWARENARGLADIYDGVK